MDEENNRFSEESYLRWILAAVNLLVASVGLFGNMFVLYASRVHHALKIDKVTVIFLESLALSDCIMSISLYLTTAVSLITGRWLFGEAMCYVSNVLTLSMAYNETMVIALLSIYRTWMLKKPPGARELINLNHVYTLAAVLQITGAIYLISVNEIIAPASNIFVCWSPGETQKCVSTLFRTGSVNCTTDINIVQHKVYTIITTSIFIIVPMTITIATTTYILNTFLGVNCGAKRNKRTYRVIKLLLFVLISFILSYGITVICSIYDFFETPPDWMMVSVKYFMAINVISNPFIYVMISPNFRDYLVSRTRCGNEVGNEEEPYKKSSVSRSEGHSTARRSDDVTNNPSES